MKKLSLAAAVMFLSFTLFAGTHEVKMLNKGSDGEKMVFEPAFLQVAVGDSVTFVAVDKGHSVEAVKDKGAVPAGAEVFKGKLNQSVTVKMDKEGAYLYKCLPHMAMGMVGVVVAGKPTNLADIKKAKFTGKAKKRMDELLKKVEAIK